MVTSAPSITDFIGSRIVHCFSEGQVGDPELNLDEVLEKLDSLPVETIAYLDGILRDESFQYNSDYALDRILIYMLNRGSTVLDIEDVACLLFTDEMILEQSSDYFDWEETEPIPSYLIKDLLLGLRSYKDIEGFPYDSTQPLRRQGERIITQSIALLNMASHLEMVNEYQLVDGMTVIPNYDVVELVVEFPDRFIDIANMMDDREWDHVVGIREVLSGEIPASLSDGVI